MLYQVKMIMVHCEVITAQHSDMPHGSRSHHGHHGGHHHVNHHKHPNFKKSHHHQKKAIEVLQISPPTSTFKEKDDEAKWKKQLFISYRNELEEALKFNPYNHEARTSLALNLARSGQRTLMEEAHRQARTILKADPSHGGAHYAIALSILHEHPIKSIHALDKALLYRAAPGRGRIHMVRKQAHTIAMKKNRDFVGSKLKEKTSRHVVERLERHGRKSMISCLLDDTEHFLDECARDGVHDAVNDVIHDVIHDDGIHEKDAHPNHPSTAGRMLPVSWSMLQEIGAVVDVGFGKKMLIEKYYEDGSHMSECRHILTAAKRCIQRKLMQLEAASLEARARQIEEYEESNEKNQVEEKNKRKKKSKKKKKNKKKVLLLPPSDHPRMYFVAIDLDDTALNSFNYVRNHGMSGSPPPHVQAEYLLKEDTAANKAVLRFVNWINQTSGLHCLFFTERPLWSKHATLKALSHAGYGEYEDLLWCSAMKEGVAGGDPAANAAQDVGSGGGGDEGKEGEEGEEGEIHRGGKSKAAAKPHGGAKSEESHHSSHVYHAHAHHAHAHFAGHTCFHMKKHALNIFTTAQRHKNDIEKKIIAIVGDQDSDFPKEMDDQEEDSVLRIKLPNYLYTME